MQSTPCRQQPAPLRPRRAAPGGVHPRGAEGGAEPGGDPEGAWTAFPTNRTPTHADWQALATAWKAQLDERIRLIGRLRDDLESCIGCGCLSMETCPVYNPSDIAYSLGHGAQYLKGRSPADAGVVV